MVGLREGGGASASIKRGRGGSAVALLADSDVGTVAT